MATRINRTQVLAVQRQKYSRSSRPKTCSSLRLVAHIIDEASAASSSADLAASTSTTSCTKRSTTILTSARSGTSPSSYRSIAKLIPRISQRSRPLPRNRARAGQSHEVNLPCHLPPHRHHRRFMPRERAGPLPRRERHRARLSLAPQLGTDEKRRWTG